MSYTQMTQDLLKVIRCIPPGYVSSYGVVAKAAGYPNGARQVVRLLNALSDKENLPWHRIVNKQGKIMLRGEGEITQIMLLEREGVLFSSEGVVDPVCFWTFVEMEAI